MKTQPTISRPGALSRPPRAAFIAALLPALLLLLTIQAGHADSSTWNLNPTSGDWNTAANWTPAFVPNGVDGTATFATSNTTGISVSAFIVLDGILFLPGASAFTIDTGFSGMDFVGPIGVANDSGITQNFITSGPLTFHGIAPAGVLVSYTINADAVDFEGNSSANSATFTIEGGFGVSFDENSTAGNSTLINSNSGYIHFNAASTAGDATLIASSSGKVQFSDSSTGGTARVEVFDQGNLDISFHNAPGVTTGSIEGSGLVFLGALDLTIGSNNLSTTFSGLIQDGSSGGGGGTGGSLTKVGTGTLTLTNANTYTGGTTIEDGTLLVNNTSGSGTGSGSVQVNAGALGGRGTIAGAVTVGTGGGAGAVLASGGTKPHTLTIQSTLTLNSDATYLCGLNTKSTDSDKIVANGVTINSAQFFFAVHGHRVIAPGTVFTVIDNTAAIPIAGTFSNLADGSTFVAHGNRFQASYEGGDGNDLTLTVQ